MANKKFSEFTVKTDPANVDFLVGYDGTDNVRIDPSNLGGGGASDLNGLTDCLVDTASLYVGEVPSGLSGNPQGNTILGINAGNSLTTGNSNIAIGFEAARDTTTTSAVIAIGSKAGRVATTGIGETIIIGNFAMNSNTGAAKSVIIGGQAGWNASGGQGLSIGYLAAPSNTNVGHHSIGYQAGFSQTSGIQNTNIGYEAGYNNTTNAFRTCIGYKAGKLNTGSGNTFIGNNAGADRANVEGHSTAVGNSAGRYWESGSNTALGENAGQYANGTSRYNVMVGRDAIGGSFGSKSNNVGVGYRAGYNLTTGFRNVLLGHQAGLALTTAYDNILIGSESGKSLTTNPNSSQNIILGTQAGFSANGANGNVILGYQAAYGLTSGETNVIIGQFASAYSGALTTGDNNTIIGFNSYPSSATVNNEITLGNSSISTLRCAVTSITSLSDERDKSEIKDLGYGLAFIDALQPREFVWDNRPELDKDGEEIYSANKGKKDFGFIAQEVQELDNDTLRLVYDSNPEKLELSYGKLVPILVQAIKELKAEVELLKS